MYRQHCEKSSLCPNQKTWTRTGDTKEPLQWWLKNALTAETSAWSAYVLIMGPTDQHFICLACCLAPACIFLSHKNPHYEASIIHIARWMHVLSNTVSIKHLSSKGTAPTQAPSLSALLPKLQKGRSPTSLAFKQHSVQRSWFKNSKRRLEA